MKTKNIVIAIVVAVGIIGVRQTNAWNIVCGAVCIGAPSGMKTMSTKWKSDSEALAGLGNFYLALSQLQAVEVSNISADTKKAEMTTEINHVDQAKSLFTETSKHLSAAISAAQELIPSVSGEDAAMSNLSVGRYKQLKDLVDSFVKAIEAHHLPELSKLHEALDLTMKISSFGRDVSQSHVGAMGHSQGGESVKW